MKKIKTNKGFSLTEILLVMGIIAIGLAAYGVFMLVKARYRRMSMV